jgi:hypothetical protein
MDYFYAPIIRGLFVATFLFAIDLDIRQCRWWVAMISIHAFVVV